MPRLGGCTDTHKYLLNYQIITTTALYRVREIEGVA
jgi:hypothetical protein